MSYQSEIIVNGSFLRHRVTGVARYSYELTRRIVNHKNVRIAFDQEKTSEFGTDKIYLVPRSFISKTLGSRAWNQFDIPLHIGDRVLWSPNNVSPLGVKKHVITIHDLSVFDHPEWFKYSIVALYNFYLPRLIQQSAKILTVSEFTRHRILERFNVNEDKVIVIPNAAAERFYPCSLEEIEWVRNRYQLPKWYILSLGSLESRKNLVNLFKAWTCVSPQLTRDIKLVVAGEKGTVFRTQDFRSDFSSVDNVHFTGYFPDQDLPALYSGALGLVYPSFYEGFGLPPLEAMACGTPVITCKNTALPEVVGDCALFVDPHQPESIATAIHSLVENSSLRESLAQGGLERAKLFNWDHSAQRLYQTLSEIC